MSYLQQTLNKHHSLSMGLSLEEIGYDMDFNAKLVACNDLDPECSTVDAEYVSYEDTLDVSAHEFHVEDRWSITDKHALTLGIHYGSDDYLDDGRIEPRTRFEYQINDKLSTYVAAGQYSQMPQLREMVDVLGNPNLTTVKSDHYVWGMSQALGGGWRWGADLYYKEMTDIVISSEQDAAAENYSNGAEGQCLRCRTSHQKRSDRSLVWLGVAQPVRSPTEPEPQPGKRSSSNTTNPYCSTWSEPDDR